MIFSSEKPPVPALSCENNSNMLYLVVHSLFCYKENINIYGICYRA